MTIPDIRIIKFDVTNDWTPGIVARAGKLFNVYIFDANRHVHVADLSPSYEMHLLGPTWTDSIEDENARQQLFEDILAGMADVDDVAYNYVRSVNVDACEKVTITPERWDEFLQDEDGDVEKAHKALLEKCREDLSANGWIY